MIAYLKPYPTMKDSGVPWLGEVPTHWNTRPLKRWVTINAEVLSETTAPDRVFRYVDIGSVGTGTLTQKPQRLRFAGAPSRARRVVHKGDTLVSTVRTYLKAIYFVDGEADELVCSTGFAVLTPRVGTVPQFVSYLARSNAFTDRVTADSVGIAYPAVAESRLGSFHVAIPPIPEQAAIVRYLDHADRRIQRYIRAKQKLITLLEEQKQAIIHHAVTGQIDVCTGRPYPAYKPSGVEWLGDVPEHWEIRTLGRIAESFRTGPFGSMLHQSDYVEDGTPVINPIHMNNGVIVEDPSCSVPEAVAERLSGYRLGLHNLVFSRRGELGRCAIVRSREVGWLCGTGSIRVRIEYKRIVPKFLIQALQVRWVGEYLSLSSVGATMDNLNTGILKGVPLLVPPIQEQRDLLERIGQRTKTIDHAIRASKEEIRLIQEYRTRLIADVVTGKLDVREAVARLPDEAEEPELRDETDGFTDGEEEPSDDLDAAPEEAAV